MNTTRRPVAAALATVALLGLSACGSSTSSSTAATSTAPAPATSGATAQATPGATAQAPEATSEPTRTVTATTTAEAVHVTAPASPQESSAPSAAQSTRSGRADAGYGPGRTLGATVKQRQDIDIAFEPTSPSFVTYATKLYDERRGGCDQASMTVDRWYPAGLATGNLQACSGYNALWFQKGGQWQEYGYQAVPQCDDVRKAGVPLAVPAETGFRCVEQGSDKPVAYTPTKA